MSKPKYLYIDDENDTSVDSIRDGFNDIGLIEVEIYPLEKTRSFEELKSNLIKLESEFDGLILDLRLDGDGPNRVGFSAPTLAQDLRTIQARRELKSFPIVLCSTEPKLRGTYTVDKSSHDLFDYKFVKSVSPEFGKFSKKLSSLSCDYAWLIKEGRSIKDVLDRDNLNDIDSRIYEKFLIGEIQMLPNDYSKFVINNLFHHPGALIKERFLAARLGIDIDESNDWKKLKEEVFYECRYSGLFSTGWERWWSDLVIAFFERLSGGKDLASLNAEQRVAILIENTECKKLVFAKPIDYCVSTEYWTVCEGHKRPLDPLEGLIVYEKSELKPWQENKYISFHAAEVERLGRDRGLKPHPMEEDKIAAMKDFISKS